MRVRNAMKVFEAMGYRYAEWFSMYENLVTGNLVEVTTGGERFSCKNYKHLIQSMFIDACGGWESRDLLTTVYNYNGKAVCTIKMVTMVDGSTIWCDVVVNDEWVRRMYIAQ